MYRKGFTLIELLVVMAIIGVMASVVLVSLQSSRATSADSIVMEDLRGIRSSALAYYNDHGNSYGTTSGDCAAVDTLFVDDKIAPAIAGAEHTGGGTAVCNASGDAWAVSAPLKTNAVKSWCVDSKNNLQQIDGALAADATSCE